MIYVTADIHGNLEKFMEMLRVIQFTSHDKLIVLGDVIDRGADGLKIIQYIRAHSNMELFLGNHEHMMLAYEKGGDSHMYSMWIQNGGTSTHKKFHDMKESERNDLLDYLSKRPLVAVEGKFILCHAGLNIYNPSLPLDDVLKSQSIEDLLWSRDDFFMYPAIEGYTVVFGHTPVPYIHKSRKTNCPKPFNIWHDDLFHDKICIDCGNASKAGRLAVLRLDDMAEFYV